MREPMEKGNVQKPSGSSSIEIKASNSSHFSGILFDWTSREEKIIVMKKNHLLLY